MRHGFERMSPWRSGRNDRCRCAEPFPLFTTLGDKGHHFHKADHEQQHPEGPFLASDQAFSDEQPHKHRENQRASVVQIVKALSDAMTLASRLAISDFSNASAKSGEFALNVLGPLFKVYSTSITF
jgi:hypothetical protein